MAKKPTNSAAFFRETPETKPAHLQVTPVMAQLMQAIPPGIPTPPLTTESPAKIKAANKAATVLEVDLPGEPPPIFDNAVGLPNGLARVKPEEKEYPTDIAAKTPEVTKEPRQQWPVPGISELPVVELTDEIIQFLHWFKDRSNAEKITDPSREHASHGPSSGERDVNCSAANPLTYLVRRDRPKEDRSSYADEGHLAHEVAAEFVQAKFEGEPYPYAKFSAKPYKPDMIKYAQDYADYCFAACEPYMHLPNSLVVEGRVCIDYVRDAWGTLDFGFIARDGDKLYAVIIDYKYGMGVDVDTENAKTGEKNWQLALYSLGIAGKYLNTTDYAVPLAVHNVTAHIFQPRIDVAVAPVVFSLPELLEKYFVKYVNAIDTSKEFIASIRQAEQAAIIWDSSVVEGHQQVGKWCRFCQAKPICKAYQHSKGVPQASDMFKKALGAGLIVKGEKEPAKKLWDQGLITAEELAFIALNGSAMKSLIDECQDVAVDLVQSGEHLPNCAVEKTEGRRSWLKDENLVINTLKELGVEQPFEEIKKLITIGEAEKIVGKGNGNLEEITEKSEGGLKLVHISKVKNPAPTGAGAALIFKQHFEKTEEK